MMEIGDEPISSIMNRSVEVIQEDSPIDDILHGCFDRKTSPTIMGMRVMNGSPSCFIATEDSTASSIIPTMSSSIAAPTMV